MKFRDKRIKLFQSAPPVRGATAFHSRPHLPAHRFNPRPPCGERQRHTAVQSGPTCFNPRPPCGERLVASPVSSASSSFNPRPPCGERRKAIRARSGNPCFNPRPPCGERPLDACVCLGACGFNPRPPCGERLCTVGALARSPFQSAPPVRGATPYLALYAEDQSVSIRAPRAGSDTLCVTGMAACYRFNPRPPCGERLSRATIPAGKSMFQSAPPVRGATTPFSHEPPDSIVSIRAPRAGSDIIIVRCAATLIVSIRAPRAGSDLNL